MNKLLLSSINILSFSCLDAQDNITWGFKGGMNISKTDLFDSKIGYHVGIKAEFQINK